MIEKGNREERVREKELEKNSKREEAEFYWGRIEILQMNFQASFSYTQSMNLYNCLFIPSSNCHELLVTTNNIPATNHH